MYFAPTGLQPHSAPGSRDELLNRFGEDRRHHRHRSVEDQIHRRELQRQVLTM